jgi:hypothetical protein
MKNLLPKFLIFTFVLIANACSNNIAIQKETNAPVNSVLTPSPVVKDFTALTGALAGLSEVEVREILLPEPYNAAKMEFSGLAWWGETLVLLPQYPGRLGQDGEGLLVTISKTTLMAYLSSDNEAPIEVGTLRFEDDGLSESLPGFEGYEAIAFSEERVYVTIETNAGSAMMGYLAVGTVGEDGSSIKLDLQKLVPLSPQTKFKNASDESLVVYNNAIYTIFEDNGAELNPGAFARVFDQNLNPLPVLEFPAIEYRVTDAAEALPDGTFWVMNYFYTGDVHLRASSDAISERFGEGGSHQRSDRVERIITLAIKDGQIILLDQPPIYLKLTFDGSSRNWEGLARLDDIGFLVVSDSFPRTILGFLPDPR